MVSPSPTCSMYEDAKKISSQTSFSSPDAFIMKGEWDNILRNPRGEDWPRMLGRLNAAYNQTTNMDKSIEDVTEHFVYLPKQSTANAQDIPFFLSTRLETVSPGETNAAKRKRKDMTEDDTFSVQGEPVEILTKYEARAAELAKEYEEDMDRF